MRCRVVGYNLVITSGGNQLVRSAKQRLKRLVYTYLPKSRLLYELAVRYINFYFNQSYESEFNGEHFLLICLSRTCTLGRVFDVGSNVGRWGSQLSTLFPGAELHSFEPSSDAFRLLARRLQGARYINNNLAVGDVSGEVEFFMFSNVGEINSLYPRSTIGHLPQVVKVPCITLNEYCQTHGIDQIDYLKIDVERHELAVLKGCDLLLRRQAISFIQFEFARTDAEARCYFWDIFTLLCEYGYRVGRIHPTGIVPVETYDPVLEYNFANYFAYLPSRAADIPITNRW